ncbi:helix-turn-helix transcriptional regulator [Marinobacterium weihaiense]|uniref:AraC family transcriptional regulator n=1 Tax=Marinobacterium weihaiense TaxID=2851016 RepID=A0ABS6M980_9GAMM|nr:AraC family transcriptional regulator [Marinobacterium weihaiense]MBV0932849.1 AraC family transcriptional regulator [Marinobacterium weihaiense]
MRQLVTLNAVKRIIHADLAGTYSLETLARAVGIHEQKLMKLFRRHEQSTVFAYIRQARMQYARTLLEQGSTPVENIAALVGFSSAANFATAFKAHTGLTPRQYRRQHQETTQSEHAPTG